MGSTQSQNLCPCPQPPGPQQQQLSKTDVQKILSAKPDELDAMAKAASDIKQRQRLRDELLLQPPQILTDLLTQSTRRKEVYQHALERALLTGESVPPKVKGNNVRQLVQLLNEVRAAQLPSTRRKFLEGGGLYFGFTSTNVLSR